MVRAVAGGVLDDPDADITELLRAPDGFAGHTGMFDRLDLAPIRGAERDVLDLHNEPY